MSKVHCTASWCPLGHRCGRYKQQTGTDTDTYMNYSNELKASSKGYTCEYFIPPKE